jgi:iron(III) transport system substrate-binding protein
MRHSFGVEAARTASAYGPEDLASYIPPEHLDRDGFYSSVSSSLFVIAYNTAMVKREDTPKSFANLLDLKWKGKIVKAHPSYSGTIMTSTYQMVRELSWSYLEQLARQQVLQIQSATDTPKKVVLGERPVWQTATSRTCCCSRKPARPIGVVYAAEGTPSIVQPSAILSPRLIPMRRACSRIIFSAWKGRSSL